MGSVPWGLAEGLLGALDRTARDDKGQPGYRVAGDGGGQLE